MTIEKYHDKMVIIATEDEFKRAFWSPADLDDFMADIKRLIVETVREEDERKGLVDYGY